jgi:hypothetical protein
MCRLDHANKPVVPQLPDEETSMSHPWTLIRPTVALLCLALAVVIGAACAPKAPDVADTAAPTDAGEPADAADSGSGGSCADRPYEINPDAAQDLIESPTGFLRCTAGSYALCYYSGAEPLPCTVDEASTTANCQCQVFAANDKKPMYVLMTSILNLCAYTEAVEQCGEDGSGCYNMCNDQPDSPQCQGVTLPDDQVQATVCDYIKNGTFNPGADYISTFSFKKVRAPGTQDRFKLGCNEATGQYAGCMTASCSGEQTDGRKTYTTCACPLFPADADNQIQPYQFGRRCTGKDTGNCELSTGQVWSAAYNPDGCPTLRDILSERMSDDEG